MAVFRVERNKGYTVMSNHHLRNKELSLKAKGLLSQMLSLPEDWDYTLKGLSLINREKIDAIREAIKELERAGYIVRSKAKQVRNVKEPLIFHCDRGCQYVSEAFRQSTKDMIHSYSKKAYPWDNACIESFHALLKREWINRFKIFNYTHAYKLIFEYIETFYNTVRIHSHCGYLSPTQYEEEYLKNLEDNAIERAS